MPRRSWVSRGIYVLFNASTGGTRKVKATARSNRKSRLVPKKGRKR